MAFLDSFPLSIGFAFIAFIASWAVHKHKIKEIEKENEEQKKEIEKLKTLRLEDKDTFFKTRERDERLVNDKFAKVDGQRESLKDSITKDIHNMDKKLTEIHTIITKK